MEYYEKYWKREITGQGVAQNPPQWNDADLSRILKIISPYCHGRVLDLGCGDGFFTNKLSRIKNVESVFGIDASITAIAECQNQYPHVIFKNADVKDLPFESDSFDFVSASEVVEHLLDAQTFFESAYRVLKKGGYLYVSTTDFNLLKKIIVAVFFWDKYFYPTNPHIRFFTKKTLFDLLKRSGFSIDKHLWNGSYFGLMPKGQIVVARKT